jgi:hypothetical protein
MSICAPPEGQRTSTRGASCAAARGSMATRRLGLASAAARRAGGTAARSMRRAKRRTLSVGRRERLAVRTTTDRTVRGSASCLSFCRYNAHAQAPVGEAS